MRYKREGLDESYFESINNEEKAYLLGFIVADGTIIKDKITTLKKAQDRLVINVQERDKDILELINKRITPYKKLNFWDHKKDNWQKQAIFKVNSNKICKDLEKFGVVNKKSGNEIFPDLKIDLIPHFIRGYFDGDGCCYNKIINKSCKHGGKLKNKIIFVCLNKNFLISLKSNLNNVGKITEKIRKGNRKNIFEYVIENKPDTAYFYYFIYKNANILLKRKYNKFLQGNPELTNILKDISSVETTC